jgi:uncharacterized protein YaiI (UPF0178 family)
LTEIYVDGDACPVREEIYRVAARLRLNVFDSATNDFQGREAALDQVSRLAALPTVIQP